VVLWRRSVDCERWLNADCKWLYVCCTSSEATWRESSSMRSRKLAVLRGAAGEMLAVVGWGVDLEGFVREDRTGIRLP